MLYRKTLENRNCIKLYNYNINDIREIFLWLYFMLEDIINVFLKRFGPPFGDVKVPISPKV